ncbi:MAG: hypothetical protein PF450_01315 [Bacteroidales bacterium]|jgi:DNA ligase-1|nr:hypothetical protein [Bacteroidales bacterium]
MLKTIEEIKKAVGNDKIEVMKAHPELKKVLEYAYNPFKKYYISAPVLGGFPGASPWLDEVYDMLDDLTNRSLSGTAAFESVCDLIVMLSPVTAELFKMILNKDLRCGINIKTINQAFPGLIPLVWDGSEKPPFALCKTISFEKIKYPCLAAVKKDGVRGQYIDKMISRQGKPLVGHNHIEDQLDMHTDGELCVPGEIFDSASGLIRNDDPTPNSVYWIFDAPSMPGTKRERWNFLRNCFIQTNSIKLIWHYEIENETQLKKFYNWAILQGEEGIVVYDPDAEYEDSRIWWRWVPFQSEDCPVISFFEGKGKHAGSLGGIIVDYKGHEVRVGTGFSEKVMKKELIQLVSPIDKKLLTLKSKNIGSLSPSEVSSIWQKNRQFIWDNREGFIGAIAKLEFKEKTKAGSMRQPRFKTFRWDKM